MNNIPRSSPLPTQIESAITLLRPKQWVKNAFVLAPLLFTGTFLDIVAVTHALLALILFCIASSATYIVNDWHDIEHDRRHPIKAKTRPLAAGTVTPSVAFCILSTLYGVLLASWFIFPDVLLVISAYAILNLAYTRLLKHQPVIDIFVIATGFVLRVYAGAVALAVPVSAWMFITTLCLALYLAAAKRLQELKHSGANSRLVLQHYSVQLVERYAEMAAMSALVFYSMFVLSSRPELVLTIPLVLFGLFRYWYVLEIQDGSESPTELLLDDWPLLLTVLSWVGFCVFTLWPA